MTYFNDTYPPNRRHRLSLLSGGSGQAFVTKVVVAICVVMWVVQFVWPNLFTYVALSGAAGEVEPWRFITSAFTHAPGVMHIASNLLVLWLVGTQLEPILGHARFLALYLLSALGGGAAWVILASPSTLSWYTGVVGASGAVFGLFGAVLVLQKTVGTSSRQLLGLLLINALIAFLMPNIAWQAHIGGFVVGAACAAAISHARDRRKPNCVWFGLMGITALVIVLIITKYVVFVG